MITKETTFKIDSEKSMTEIENIANILLKMTPEEIETLEILLDKESMSTISASLQEAQEGKVIPINEW